MSMARAEKRALKQNQKKKALENTRVKIMRKRVRRRRATHCAQAGKNLAAYESFSLGGLITSSLRSRHQHQPAHVQAKLVNPHLELYVCMT